MDRLPGSGGFCGASTPSSPRRRRGRTRLRLCVTLAVPVALLGACKSSSSDNPAIGGGGVGQTQDVTMVSYNGGQAGTATLGESPSLVFSVTVHLSAPTQGTAAASEPADIRPGTCANPDPTAKFPLTPVVNGQSDTPSLNTTLGEMQSSPYVIVVHRSAQDPAVISCGAIPIAGATSS